MLIKATDDTLCYILVISYYKAPPKFNGAGVSSMNWGIYLHENLSQRMPAFRLMELYLLLLFFCKEAGADQEADAHRDFERKAGASSRRYIQRRLRMLPMFTPCLLPVGLSEPDLLYQSL